MKEMINSHIHTPIPLQSYIFYHMRQVNLGFFWSDAISTSHILERQSKIICCVSTRESLEVGDGWGHQLNKPNLLSCCFTSTTLLQMSVSPAPTELEHICSHIFKYINLYATYWVAKISMDIKKLSAHLQSKTVSKAIYTALNFVALDWYLSWIMDYALGVYDTDDLPREHKKSMHVLLKHV